MPIADILRKELAAAVSLRQVSQATGIGYATIHDFHSGKRDIYLATAQRLLEHFGYETAKKQRRKTATNKPGKRSK